MSDFFFGLFSLVVQIELPGNVTMNVKISSWLIVGKGCNALYCDFLNFYLSVRGRALVVLATVASSSSSDLVGMVQASIFLSSTQPATTPGKVTVLLEAPLTDLLLLCFPFVNLGLWEDPLPTCMWKRVVQASNLAYGDCRSIEGVILTVLSSDISLPHIVQLKEN